MRDATKRPLEIPEWFWELVENEEVTHQLSESVMNAYNLVNSIEEGKEEFEIYLRMSESFEKKLQEEIALEQSYLIRKKGLLN